MAKWSVTLFGHWKPRYELREVEWSDHIPIVAHGYHGEPYYYDRDSFSQLGGGYANTGYRRMTTDIKKAGSVKIQKTISRHVELPTEFDSKKYFVYNVLGWEKRAEPGDVIAFKAYRHQIGIVGYSKLHEYGRDTWTETERKHFLIITLDNLEYAQMPGICEPYWDTNSYKFPDVYPEKAEAFYPTQALKKRRFNIPLDDLKQIGVDETKMLDTNTEYMPDLRDIQKIECRDKLNERYVLESDQLRLIEPVMYGGVI
jgi:hypothetical protein